MCAPANQLLSIVIHDTPSLDSTTIRNAPLVFDAHIYSATSVISMQLDLILYVYVYVYVSVYSLSRNVD